MSDFIEPKRVVIDVAEAWRKFLGGTLVKDVPDGYRICGACGGLGVVKFDMKYGLREAPGGSVNFPYHEEHFYPCPNCTTGIVKVCPHCDGDIPKVVRECRCKRAEAEREVERARKDAAEFAAARRVEPDSEEALGMGMLYCEGGPGAGFFDDMDEFITWWEDEHVEGDVRPEYVWGTEREELRIDAAGVLENACDDLHEDAAENISAADFTELKEFLDKWCAKQTGTMTYIPDYGVLVRVPWPEADNGRV